MAIKITVGVEYYGLVRQQDGSVLATRCAHVSFLPVFPLGTWRIGLSAQKAPLSLKSLFAAFFKPWGFIWALFLGWLGLFAGDWYFFPAHKMMSAISALLFLGVYASWLWLGHAGRISKLRYGIVGGLAVATFATIAFGVVSQLQTSDELASDPEYDEQLVADGFQSAAALNPKLIADYPSSSDPLKPGDRIEVHVMKGFVTGTVISTDWHSTRFRSERNNREYVSRTYTVKKLSEKL